MDLPIRRDNLGWIHILVGIIAVLAGIGLFSGAVWVRTLAVIIAAVSIFANFIWLPYYPIWAAVIIVFDFFVIWALTAHGRDVTVVNDRGTVSQSGNGLQ